MPEVENEKNLYASCGWISNLAFGLLLLRCRAWEVDGRKATHVNYFWDESLSTASCTRSVSSENLPLLPLLPVCAIFMHHTLDIGW